jgi:hypothetical protein
MSDDETQPSFSDDDLDKMVRRGYAEHVVEGIGEVLFGEGGWDTLAQNNALNAWAEAHERFSGEDIRPNEEGHPWPVLHGSATNWDFSHPVGGAYVDIHAPGDPQPSGEVIHVGHVGDESDRQLYKPTVDEIRSAVDEYDRESGDDLRWYLEQERKRRSR